MSLTEAEAAAILRRLERAAKRVHADADARFPAPSPAPPPIVPQRRLVRRAMVGLAPLSLAALSL